MRLPPKGPGSDYSQVEDGRKEKSDGTIRKKIEGTGDKCDCFGRIITGRGSVKAKFAEAGERRRCGRAGGQKLQR